MMIFFSHHGSLSVLFFLSCCLYAWRYDELSSLKTDLRQADWLLSWRRNYMEHKLTMTNKWIACEALYITSFLFGVSLFSVPFYFPSALLNISLQIFGVKCYGVIACQIMSLGLLFSLLFFSTECFLPNVFTKGAGLRQISFPPFVISMLLSLKDTVLTSVKRKIELICW